MDAIFRFLTDASVWPAAIAVLLAGLGGYLFVAMRPRRRPAAEADVDELKYQLQRETELRTKLEQMHAVELRMERMRREEAELASRVVGAAGVSLDEVKRLQDERDERDFDRNRASTIVIEHLEFRGVAALDDGTWTLQPGINLLLGRNGYGKSLVLRTVAALLTRHARPLVALGPASRATLALSVNGTAEAVAFEDGSFRRSPGPVPVLAIPDVRFANRSEESIRPPVDPFTDLARHGARHLIEQLSYQGIVQGLLHGLCLDYFDKGRHFELPVFKLLSDVFAGLTDSSFRFAAVERVDVQNFQLKVITEGYPTPVPIQAASQGTLSVLAIFGLVFRFLAMLADSEELATQQRAIVMIDEIDAHLHPHWQQRVAALLRRHFPDVQFILSAHSPLLVAGCLAGEVAVLRKSERGFFIEPQARDFLGARVKDVYQDLFDIEDGRDPAYLAYSEQAARGIDLSTPILELEAHGDLDEAQRIELARLRADAAAIRRAQSIEAERAHEDDAVARLETELVGMQSDLEQRAGRVQALEQENARLRAQADAGPAAEAA
jgi:hypothetical protein